MIACKLCDLISVLDKRTIIEFSVSSFESIAHYEGDVLSFVKNWIYQVYATNAVCDIRIRRVNTFNYVMCISVLGDTE